MQTILLAAACVYRALISPLLTAVFLPLGFGCRFTPTCSQYAMQAITRYGTFRGTWLALRRLCRCHPWGGCGCDPVPTRTLPVSRCALPVTQASDWGAPSPTSQAEAARRR